MTKKQILIAGEPLSVLNQTIPSLEVTRCGEDAFRVTWPTDSESGAAWVRAIERCAADLVTVDRNDPIEIRHTEALLLIGKALAVANGSDV